jgi:hypothetical protein
MQETWIGLGQSGEKVNARIFVLRFTYDRIDTQLRQIRELKECASLVNARTHEVTESKDEDISNLVFYERNCFEGCCFVLLVNQRMLGWLEGAYINFLRDPELQ